MKSCGIFLSPSDLYHFEKYLQGPSMLLQMACLNSVMVEKFSVVCLCVRVCATSLFIHPFNYMISKSIKVCISHGTHYFG